MNGRTDIFARQLSALDKAGNLRHLPHLTHDGKYAVADGRKMLNLSSNDYLGLASDPELPLMRRFLEEVAGQSKDTVPESCLLSASSSRLLTGTFGAHEQLERTLCRLSGRPAALVFSSGYHMNIGILPAISDERTVILADKLVHASIIDGIRLSSAKSVRFRHQDMSQLESLVKKYHDGGHRVIIVTESIFSMDGDVTDLKYLAELKKAYPDVMLYVDEAHAAGARGETGMGIAQEKGVLGDIDLLCGTFGKALASAGAYVLCESEMREFLVNRMRSLIFTTALPPFNMLWTLRVLENMEAMASRRKMLHDNALKIRSALLSRGLPCPSESHIIPVMVGDSHDAVSLAEKMQRSGFYLLPVRPPTVPEGTSRLRISLTAAVTPQETDELIDTLVSLDNPRQP